MLGLNHLNWRRENSYRIKQPNRKKAKGASRRGGRGTRILVPTREANRTLNRERESNSN